MNVNGAIVLIEDDKDDQFLMRRALESLGCPNEIIFLDDPEQAYSYLSEMKTKPFIVFSDINMPCLNGLELRDKLFSEPALGLKCTPFLFLSTATTDKMILEAYSRPSQGYFVKPESMDGLKELFRNVIEYWKTCKTPPFTSTDAVVQIR